MTQKGFIALFSVVIISFILLLMTVTLNFSGLFGRFNILDSEYKEVSANLSNACLEVARLAVAQGSYAVDNVVLVESIGTNNESCEYVITVGNKIEAHACVNDAHTFYQAGFNAGDTEVPLVTFTELTNSDKAFTLCF